MGINPCHRFWLLKKLKKETLYPKIWAKIIILFTSIILIHSNLKLHDTRCGVSYGIFEWGQSALTKEPGDYPS